MKPLFRAKALSGEWVQGNFIHSKRFAGCFNEYRIYDRDTGMEHDVDPETVGQFTGKDDMNGCKIFDGDIISTFHFTSNGKDYCLKHIVKWDESKHAFIAVSGASKNLETGNGTCFLYINLKQQSPQVIGNIHDNPELL